MSDVAGDPGVAAAAIAHVAPLIGLDRKVDPRHTALIVVDVQNDFCAEGGMMHAEGLDLGTVQAMAGRLPGLIASAREAGALVVFVRNVYSSEGNAYLSDVWLEQASRRRGDSYTRRDVCAADSWEGDFFGDVAPRPGDPIVTKHRFSAFHNTDLDTILRSHGIRTLVMTGVASNVCVETTAREGFVRDYYVVFLEDGTAAYRDEDHAATLRVIDRFFGQVASIDDVARAWERTGGTAPER
jgi:ureidoacrylate peracid hydrolase